MQYYRVLCAFFASLKDQLVMNPSIVLAAFGNPLLDIIVSVKSKEEEQRLFSKYNLIPHVGQEMDTSALYSDVMTNKEITLSPGGCALNTCRIFQWLTPTLFPRSVHFGSVGKDEFYSRLKDFIVNDGVATKYEKQSLYPTGHVIALTHGTERTMIANLGASSHYSLSHYISHEDSLRTMKVIYVEGFFLHQFPKIVTRIAETCTKNSIILALNLSGEIVCQNSTFVENVKKLLPQINFLFGNQSEFDNFCSLSNLHFDNYSCVSQNDNREQFEHNNVSQIATSVFYTLITNSDQPIICYDRRKKIYSLTPVPSVKNLRDTVGAGDGFVAGYLSALIDNQNSETCIQTGIFASQAIMSSSGTLLPSRDSM